jgi:hypothetical protein
MRTIAAPAPTDNRIDYWIPPNIIQYCYGAHPSQSKHRRAGGRQRTRRIAPIGRQGRTQLGALAMSPVVYSNPCISESNPLLSIMA